MGRIRMRQIEVMELEQHDYLFPTMTNAHFIGYRTSSIFDNLNNEWPFLRRLICSENPHSKWTKYRKKALPVSLEV